jgi:hypothetical protein
MTDVSFKINTPPILMTFYKSNSGTGKVGEFKEVNGLLTFEGNVDESAKLFVDRVCELFKQRIEELYGKSKK